VGISSSFPGV